MPRCDVGISDLVACEVRIMSCCMEDFDGVFWN